MLIQYNCNWSFIFEIDGETPPSWAGVGKTCKIVFSIIWGKPCLRVLRAPIVPCYVIPRGRRLTRRRPHPPSTQASVCMFGPVLLAKRAGTSTTARIGDLSFQKDSLEGIPGACREKEVRCKQKATISNKPYCCF